MYDLLAAINAALIPLSTIFLWYFTDYQIKSQNDDQSTAVARFGWSLFCISIGMCISSILYFLWDYDIIYKSTQIKLSIMPRTFFVIGLMFGFHALELPWNKTLSIVATCLAMGVFVVRVVW